MGIYFNPNNDSFRKDKRNQIYVDKTELLNFLNEVIETSGNCIAVSHARRFGKSHAAGMIDAYYSRGCDSAELFNTTKIAKSPDYKRYMNKYNVIHLDISSFWDDFKENIVEKIQEYVLDDLKKIFGDKIDFSKKFSTVLMEIYKLTDIPFVIIIDEWDCVIRNSPDKELVHRYLQFMHSLFKSEESKAFLALAYITGILPIKKIKDESALNNFREFTMLKSRPITQYYGFTEDEVKKLCEKSGRDFDLVKKWYDGYLLGEYHIYNPKAVSNVIKWGNFQSYWSQTGTYDSIQPLINKDFDGLKSAIVEMISGAETEVKTTTFQNDMVTFRNKNDVMTLLIHLGYLAYDQKRQMAYIPNEEIRMEFMNAVEDDKWNELIEFETQSERLFEATLDMEEKVVAEYIDKIHNEYASTIQYNNENSLSSQRI